MAAPPFTSTHPASEVIELDFQDGEKLIGYAATPVDSAGAKITDKVKNVPIVLVWPNYAGLKLFDRHVAGWFAKLGYIGLAVDYYTADQVPHELRDRSQIAAEGDPAKLDQHRDFCLRSMDKFLLSKVRSRFRPLCHAWVGKAVERFHGGSAAQPARIATMGYCLGGMAVLEMARSGCAPLSGVVSLHGLLTTQPLFQDTPWLKEENAQSEMKDSVLIKQQYAENIGLCIEHGEKDRLVPVEMQQAFMDEVKLANEVGKNWKLSLNRHEDAPHGFALAPGVSADHHDEADRTSTRNMIAFLRDECFADYWKECEEAGVEFEGVDKTPAGLVL